MLSAAAGSVMIKTEDFGVQEETADFFFPSQRKRGIGIGIHALTLSPLNFKMWFSGVNEPSFFIETDSVFTNKITFFPEPSGPVAMYGSLFAVHSPLTWSEYTNTLTTELI